MQKTMFTKACKVGFAILNVLMATGQSIFPQYGIEDDIATIAVKETDLKQIAAVDASINTRIHSQFTA